MFVAADFLPLFTPYLWSFVHTRVWRIAQLNLDDSWVKRRLTKTGLVMLQGEGIKEIANESDEDTIKTFDSNGTLLLEGDTVTLIKDLDVKGTSFVAKRGTTVKNIHLTNNPENIEGRVNKMSIVLKTCFLKKIS